MSEFRPQLQIIDAFGAFLSFWEHAQTQPLVGQIEAWSVHYISQWPELRQKLIECYAEEGEDWRAIARGHVFPFLSERLPTMHTAHSNLLSLCADLYKRCQQALGFDSDLVCVIYVGIGCGAGWATTYGGDPAILFGLENIAEEGWQEQETLAGLMAHELGHLVHFHWRARAGLAQAGMTDGEGPWWQLYTEGFAQWCEHLIQAKSWHMQKSADDAWQKWCRANLSWLAAEFLRRVDAGQDIRPFFGSWHDLRGYKQTGYFLGHELVKALQAQATLHEVALLRDPATHLRPLLAAMAG